MGAAVGKKAGTLRAMVLGIVCVLALALGIAPMAAFADGDSESDADVVYGLKVYDANPSIGDGATFVTSDNFLNQTFRQTLEENGIPTRVWNLETQTGDTRTLADGSTTYLYSIEFRTTKGKVVNLDSTPADILDEFYWIEGDPEGQLYLEVDLTWNPQSYNGKWEPFTPTGSATTLLPYVINNSVLSFPDYPGLGEWYQLDAKLSENVEFNGVIWGGGDDRTMTILRGYLNEDDSFHNDDTGGQTFPLWLRGDHGTDNYTFLQFEASDLPAGTTMQCRLEPASAGTITSDMTTGIYDGTWVGNYRVQLDAPATIVVEPSTTTTVKSKSGATVEVPVSEDDPSYYNGTLLVADELDGTEAQGAKAKLTAKVADVTNSVAYDLHFEKYVWNGTSMVTETMLPKDGDTIKVTLPIPEELSTDGLHVYYVAEDGTVTDMNGTVDADARTITFETTHFSTYVLANVKGSEPTKPTEPTNPTKPTEPTNPTDPATPTEPTTPINPTDPATPTDSVETTTKTTVSTASVKEKPKSPSAGASATPETGDNAIGSSAVAAVAAAAFATLGIAAVLRRRSQS